MTVNPFQQAINQLAAQFKADYNNLAATLRVRDNKLQELKTQVNDLQKVLNALHMDGGESPAGGVVCPWTGQIRRIEDIPGARVPYVLLAEIPIDTDSTTRLQQSVPISQEGPFVAVRRVATFVSSHAFQVTDPTTEQVARFSGRSNGRYRPVSSSWDIFDAMGGRTDSAAFYLRRLLDSGFVAGDIMPSAALALPTNQSGFRTMEMDFTVRVVLESSQMARQNQEIPSSIWVSGINDPTSLGALDFFARNESVTFEIQPNHVNNPPFGNVDGLTIFPNSAATGWPFTDGQYDAHEGIATPECSDISAADDDIPDLIADDPIERSASGILIVGFEGYKIVQPIG
jgi:hypothetical protein